MTDDGALFPIDPAWRPAAPGVDPTAELSPGRRLTLRQAALIARGRHPLTRGPLHAEAAPGDDQDAEGRRCGNCRFRVTRLWGDTAKHYPKCSFGWDGRYTSDPPRATRGPATDCRAWWPGCLDHQYEPDTTEAEQ